MVHLIAMAAISVTSLASAAQPSWEQTSEQGRFLVRFAPQAESIVVGQFQSWIITLRDDGGKPVYPARIGVAGGMPGHGHGMPTQPQVTKYLGDGRYLVEGMKFNMAGDWLFNIVIETPAGRDRATLDITIDY